MHIHRTCNRLREIEDVLAVALVGHNLHHDTVRCICNDTLVQLVQLASHLIGVVLGILKVVAAHDEHQVRLALTTEVVFTLAHLQNRIVDLLLEVVHVALAEEQRVQRRIVVAILNLLLDKSRNHLRLVIIVQCPAWNRELLLAVRQRKAPSMLRGIGDGCPSVKVGQTVDPVLHQ